MFARTLVTATLTAAVLCGCNPDETKVTVNASALKSAAEGKVATAKVELRLDSNLPFESEIAELISRKARPFLGKDAEIRIEPTHKDSNSRKGTNNTAKVQKEKPPQARFIANFDIPLGTASALREAPPGILQLEYTEKDKTFRLVYGRNMSPLNSALRKMDSSFALEYPGGYISAFLFSHYETTITVLNDEKITLGVAAVNVNGKGVIAENIDTHDGSLLIDYGNKVYTGKAPCFMYGGFQQAMPSWSPAKKAWGK